MIDFSTTINADETMTDTAAPVFPYFGTSIKHIPKLHKRAIPVI